MGNPLAFLLLFVFFAIYCRQPGLSGLSYVPVGPAMALRGTIMGKL